MFWHQIKDQSGPSSRTWGCAEARAGSGDYRALNPLVCNLGASREKSKTGPLYTEVREQGRKRPRRWAAGIGKGAHPWGMSRAAA